MATDSVPSLFSPFSVFLCLCGQDLVFRQPPEHDCLAICHARVLRRRGRVQLRMADVLRNECRDD